MKKDRHGKAAIFTRDEIIKIRKAFADYSHHRAIFEIALFTGERIGAIIQLKVSDVYQNVNTGKLNPEITFKAATRKNKSDTRQIIIHPDLASFLSSYTPPESGYLFRGKNQGHISYNAVYLFWKQKFLELGLDHRGFSCHSTRRWFITNLVQNGIDLKTVQSLTGHKNISVLLGYVEETLQLKEKAIASLSV